MKTTTTMPSFSAGSGLPQEAITLQFSGKATTMQIDALLDLLEKMLVNEGINNSLRRRIYSISMEALQNLNNHAPDQVLDAINEKTIDPAYIKFLFEGCDGKFRIETSNYILLNNIDPFIQKLDYINSLDELAKKEYYNYLIKNLPFSEKGGAGLGLVDIARKSKQPINYRVVGTNTYYSLVTLSVSLEAASVSVPFVTG